MLHIGCHLSSSKGYRHMGEDALSINADTFQFFTRNPRGSKAKKADPKDAEALRGLMEEHAFAPVLGRAGRHARGRDDAGHVSAAYAV